MTTFHVSPTTFWSTSKSASILPLSGDSLSFQVLPSLHVPVRRTSPCFAEATPEVPSTPIASTAIIIATTLFFIPILLHAAEDEPRRERAKGDQSRRRREVKDQAGRDSAAVVERRRRRTAIMSPATTSPMHTYWAPVSPRTRRS